MALAILIVGPRDCGKTLHGKALAEHFGCSTIVDDWRPHLGFIPGALHLTSLVPGGPALPYVDDTMRALHFNDAMRQMTDAHAALLA